MGEQGSSIPVVDISALAVDKQDWEPARCTSETQQLMDAFKNIGFVYLINHGVKQEMIDRVNQEVKKFFSLPADVKEKYRRMGSSENQGWIAPETEALNPKRPGDLKESYNITPAHKQVWPDEEVPDFRVAQGELRRACEELTVRVLRLLSLGLGLDPELFEKAHIPWDESSTTMRCLYYSPLPPSLEVKPEQVRCGEHSDYGSITLLFQDDVGGLEVRNRDNEWVAATPIAGSVLVNIADLMQRWTSDVLVSTPHRVLIPKREVLEKRNEARQSIAYFAHPRDAYIVEPMDGSAKYPPISGLDYLNLRFSSSYSY